MLLRSLFAAVHLLALGIGLGAVWGRARAFAGELDQAGLRRLFHADAWWGISALLWISTGLTRLLAGLEKATPYYLDNHLFWTKMGLLALVLMLEIAPMVALIRWRLALRRKHQPDTGAALRYARISYLQAGLVVLMVLVASALSRGHGLPGA
jgi:putative membrane protein